MARADAPNWRSVPLLSVPLIYLPLLAGAYAGGHLARLDERAVIILRLNEPAHRRLLRILVTATCAAILWGAFFAVGYATVPALTAEITLRSDSPAVGRAFGAIASTVYVLGPLLPVLVSQGRLGSTIISGYAEERAVRARLGQTRSGGVRITGFAAWPQGRGHGGRLAEAVKPVLESALLASGTPMIVVARTAALALVYQRWGLRSVAPGSRVLIAGASPPAPTQDGN